MSNFSYLNPFVVANHHCYKYIQKAWEELQTPNIFCPMLPVGPLTQKQVDVLRFVSQFEAEPSYFKKRHLLLYGPSGAGKTTAILHAICNRRVYFAGDVTSRFIFSDLTDKYDCALLDEFELSVENRSIILNLLNGTPTMVNFKCQQSRLIEFPKLCIFATNNQITDEAFLNRVHVISFQ